MYDNIQHTAEGKGVNLVLKLSSEYMCQLHNLSIHIFKHSTFFIKFCMCKFTANKLNLCPPEQGFMPYAPLGEGFSLKSQD